MDLPSLLRRRWSWLVAIVVVVVLLPVAGTWAYINFVRGEPDERLTFADVEEPAAANGAMPSPTTTTTGATTTSEVATTTTADPDIGIDGTWVTTDASIVGYRVTEVLFGQDAVGTGRTSQVDGELEIEGTTIETAGFTVDVASITSDDARRDGQFRGRIMDTETFPTATFSLTEPIALNTLPPEGEERMVSATGELTLRGVTNAVTFDLLARRSGGAIEVNGTIPVDFDAFAIPDASGGPASVGRTGELELLLVFEEA